MQGLKFVGTLVADLITSYSFGTTENVLAAPTTSNLCQNAVATLSGNAEMS
jgi:hypothetical protein